MDNVVSPVRFLPITDRMSDHSWILGVTLVSIALCLAQPVHAQSPDTIEVSEVFTTPRDTWDNVDTPAVWHGAEGQHWLLTTAKEGDVIRVHDAATGAPIRRVGGAGTDLGQLDRPNAVTVIDDLMIVVERDNRRVQVFSLPEFEPLGAFGEPLGWQREVGVGKIGCGCPTE